MRPWNTLHLCTEWSSAPIEEERHIIEENLHHYTSGSGLITKVHKELKLSEEKPNDSSEKKNGPGTWIEFSREKNMANKYLIKCSLP